MTLGVASDTLRTWPAQSVRDTVAEIVRDDAFQRVFTQSFWQRVVEWTVRAFRELLRLLPDVRIANAVLVTATTLLVVLIVARLALRLRAEREIWAGDRTDGRAGRRADPWIEAERLAGTGAYVEAAHALCGALLAACARRGEVQLHPSKTTGDYSRELRRRRAPSEHAFEHFRARYDRVVYDAQRCSAEEYAALLVDARPLLAVERAA